MDNLGIGCWQPGTWLTLILFVTLVSGAVGWAAASARYMHLAGQVAEMEAAVVRYWDRVRKRVSIEANDKRPEPKTVKEWTEAEIDEVARKHGLYAERVHGG